MKIVCIDNHVLIWGIKEYATEGQENMILRAKSFFNECRENETIVMVPSIVVGEFLTSIEPNYHAMTINLLQNAFQIAPYDAQASTIFAKIWREKHTSNLLHTMRNEMQATRAELKADCMIVATAIARKAEKIYSHDVKLKNFAIGKIEVVEIPEIIIKQQKFDL